MECNYWWNIFELKMQEKIDLTPNFKVIFYNGHKNPDNIQKLLKHKSLHHLKTTKNKPKILILESTDGFTLTEFKIQGPPYQDYSDNFQIKSG